MNKLLKTLLTLGAAFLLAVSSFAAGSLLTIEVDPSIKILVNGEEFKPKDVNGNDVMTFVYNGTTYAPLRALAEAYGLEVGYDGALNMATVSESTSAPVDVSTTFTELIPSAPSSAAVSKSLPTETVTITHSDSSMTESLINELEGMAVFWAPQGDKMHLDPECRSFKLGITYAGTFEQAQSVREQGWCGWCSKGYNDSSFSSNSNATKSVLADCYTYEDFIAQIPAVGFD